MDQKNSAPLMQAAPFLTVTKTYGHEQGLSATFRQWRATSHCRFLHGYALSFAFTFGCYAYDLDENGWVINFGALKPLKQWLQDTFDHKTLVAKDDPLIHTFRSLRLEVIRRELYQREHQILGPLIQLVEVERTGCEGFAKMAYDWVNEWLLTQDHTRARLLEVAVREHGANGVTYAG